MVPAHEIVDKVTKVGSELTHFKPGDRVSIGCLVDSCRVCPDCHDNPEQLHAFKN